MNINTRTCRHGIKHDWSIEDKDACIDCNKEWWKYRCHICLQESVISIGTLRYCNNPECKDYGKDLIESSCFSNPLYLMVKMKLAEAIHIINRRYDIENHNCVNYSKEIVQFMTKQEIRCGYTVITFDNNNGHAIVAFETDYGLVYFEPQNGNQEYPEIGKPYHECLDGIPTNSLITDIKIDWNC